MRAVALGHWNYFTWHLPATLLSVGLLVLVFAIARSLWRHTWGPAAKALRYRILGWAAVCASFSWAVAWPYLRAPANVRVDSAGTWHLSNYLGIPVGSVPAHEVRSVRAVDLGGLGVGMGHLEVRRANGTVYRTVRIAREDLDALKESLGYGPSLVHEEYGDQLFAPHTYSASGPVAVAR